MTTNPPPDEPAPLDSSADRTESTRADDSTLSTDAIEAGQPTEPADVTASTQPTEPVADATAFTQPTEPVADAPKFGDPPPPTQPPGAAGSPPGSAWNAAGGPPPGYNQPPRRSAARLQRSSSERVLAGVCGGLGRHTGVDPILFRIAFVALVFAAGTGILLYIALAILMPSDNGQPLWQRGARNADPLNLWHRQNGEPPAAGVSHPPVPKGPRSPVPGVTIAVLLIGVGVVALAERYGDWSLDPSGYFAIAVAIVGVGLLVSAFGPWRRSKAGLITLGLMLSLGLFVTTAVDDRGGFDRSTFSDQTYRPLTEGEIQNSYRVLMGESTLDLSQVDFSSSDSTEIDIEVTMGNFEVLVPRDAAIRYNGETSFGSVSVFGARDIGDGFYYPGAGAGVAADEENPDLILNVDVQFGNAEVRRVG